MRLDYFQDQEITLTLKLNGISNPNHRHNPEKAERVFCVSGFVCFLVYVEWSNFRMNPWIWRWDEQQHFRKNRRKLIEIEIFRILRLVRPLILILLTARKKRQNYSNCQKQTYCWIYPVALKSNRTKFGDHTNVKASTRLSPYCQLHIASVELLNLL